MTSILERRRIEAEFAKSLLGALERHLPREQARTMLAEAIVAMARDAGAAMAKEAGGAADLVAFAALLPRWQQDNALAIDFLVRSPERLDFNVTRCRYAELYRELGVPELGAILSCNRDGEFCRGYNPAIRMQRTQTIMQGAAHCDFRYTQAPADVTGNAPST
jgi:predicted ArsR family transcriptional regulator